MRKQKNTRAIKAEQAKKIAQQETLLRSRIGNPAKQSIRKTTSNWLWSEMSGIVGA